MSQNNSIQPHESALLRHESYTVEDLIIALLCRDRKQRIAVQSPSKYMPKHRMQLELIMSHPFFECISNKKNNDYPYTWHHIRQRERMQLVQIKDHIKHKHKQKLF
eukprot:243957_1